MLTRIVFRYPSTINQEHLIPSKGKHLLKITHFTETIKPDENIYVNIDFTQAQNIAPGFPMPYHDFIDKAFHQQQAIKVIHKTSDSFISVGIVEAGKFYPIVKENQKKLQQIGVLPFHFELTYDVV